MEGFNKRGKQHQIQDMSGKQVNQGKEQSKKEANEGGGKGSQRQARRGNQRPEPMRVRCEYYQCRLVAVVVAPGRCRCRRQGCRRRRRRRRVVGVVALEL
jgi:hypothetical protein